MVIELTLSMIRRRRRHSTSWTKAACCGCATTARDHRSVSAAPVLFVYSLLKRPYILDLLPERSLVRTFCAKGFPSTSPTGSRRLPGGCRARLAQLRQLRSRRAVECVRRREHVERVSLVGCCLGALLAVIYAALYPRTFNAWCRSRCHSSRVRCSPRVPRRTLVRLYGNVPAWWIT